MAIHLVSCSLRVRAVFVVLDLVYRLRHARAQTDSSLALFVPQNTRTHSSQQIHDSLQHSSVSVLLQVFQMCFNGSLSNNWRCEASQQADKADQVTARNFSSGHSQDR